MARLAWFTPFPPDRSGIAAYSAEVLPALARTHEIDVFIDATTGPGAVSGTRDLPFRVLSAHDFPWRHARDPYDLTVYQLGNSHSHDYMWGYFVRYPGLSVLHDAQVHQARAEHLFARGRLADYAEELRFSHDDVPDGVRDLFVAGLGGRLFYFWPLLGVVLHSARVIAVHHRWLATSLGEQYPAATVVPIRHGIPATRGDGRRVRARFGIPPESVLFAAFGRVTPEKRTGQILRALAQVRATVPNATLLLVGEQAEYYDVEAEAGAVGVSDRVIRTGYVPDEDMGDYIDAADVCLCLRWPTGREASGAWLRCIAGGKATIVTDLCHLSDIPALDPRNWNRLAAHRDPRFEQATDERPIAVAIDILDEQHSLNLAMRRLGTDTVLRDDLGREARGYWRRGLTVDAWAADYLEAIERARSMPDPDPGRLPAHLLADGTTVARAIAGRMGVKVDFLGR